MVAFGDRTRSPSAQVDDRLRRHAPAAGPRQPRHHHLRRRVEADVARRIELDGELAAERVLDDEAEVAAVVLALGHRQRQLRPRRLAERAARHLLGRQGARPRLPRRAQAIGPPARVGRLVERVDVARLASCRAERQHLVGGIEDGVAHGDPVVGRVARRGHRDRLVVGIAPQDLAIGEAHVRRTAAGEHHH